MVEFSNEKINLSHEILKNFQFLELPNDNYFLTYQSGLKPKIISMMRPIDEPSGWSENIPQNAPTAFQEVNFLGRLEEIYYYFDHKGDICALFNINIRKNDFSEYVIYSSVSHNYGKKWGAPRRISPEDLSIRVVGTPIILTKGYFFGHIVVPVEDTNIARYLFLFSQDNGKSWNFSLCVEKDEDEDEPLINRTDDQGLKNKFLHNDDGIVYPPIFSIIEGDNGIIHGICRFHNDSYLSTCSTKDLGTTWSGPQFISEIGLPDFKHFSISHVLHENNAKTMLFGIERNENSLVLVVWLASRFEGPWERVWENSHAIDAKTEVCLCSQDTKGKVHLFYNTSKTEIVHLWGDGSTFGYPPRI